MKKIFQAAAVTLMATSAAQAQQAVQWPVSDGGNGHWYQRNSQPLSWTAARQFALAEGGDLATLTTQTESAFAFAVDGGIGNCWIGGFQSADACEPACQWTWVTGEPWLFSAWRSGQPDNTSGTEDSLCFWGGEQSWNDGTGSDAAPSVVEWSTDCNGDGIVDYGQCRDGTLSDYNGNNIPDCCERDETCVVGSYPVQWRLEDGGNDHWYEVHPLGGPTPWAVARAEAKALGGDLASLESPTEPSFIYKISGNSTGWGSRVGPWLGGFQDTSASDFVEPGGGWRWTSGAPWSFADWGQAEPNNSPAPENYLHLISNNCPGYPDGRFFNDVRGDFAGVGPCDKMPISAIIEWSADCNHDNIVDYGQILQGQLADLNTDGVPDVCQQPTCVDADLFRNGVINGADLGILLSQWGPAPAGTVSDINRDGQVNGADLGYLLNAWGPCAN
jgi:hypothetical protein